MIRLDYHKIFAFLGNSVVLRCEAARLSLVDARSDLQIGRERELIRHIFTSR
jgi:hypothetical protein